MKPTKLTLFMSEASLSSLIGWGIWKNFTSHSNAMSPGCLTHEKKLVYLIPTWNGRYLRFRTESAMQSHTSTTTAATIATATNRNRNYNPQPQYLENLFTEPFHLVRKMYTTIYLNRNQNATATASWPQPQFGLCGSIRLYPVSHHRGLLQESGYYWWR